MKNCPIHRTTRTGVTTSWRENAYQKWRDKTTKTLCTEVNKVYSSEVRCNMPVLVVIEKSKPEKRSNKNNIAPIQAAQWRSRALACNMSVDEFKNRVSTIGERRATACLRVALRRTILVNPYKYHVRFSLKFECPHFSIKIVSLGPLGWYTFALELLWGTLPFLNPIVISFNRVQGVHPKYGATSWPPDDHFLILQLKLSWTRL